jgi:vacuolar-type H+-ATPase subunit H
MQGLELVKNLVKLEHELAEKLEEARRLADQRIARAEEKARHILDEAEAEISRMVEATQARAAEEERKLSEKAHTRAEVEADNILRQAGPHIDRAVEFILTEVLP